MIRSTFRATTGQPRATWRSVLTTILAVLALSSTAIPAQAYVPVPSAPLSPVITSSGATGETTITVSWLAPLQAPTAVGAYQLQYSSDQGATWTNRADVLAPTTSATITALTAGRSYIVRLRAVDTTGLLFSPWVVAANKLDRFAQVVSGGDTSCGVLRSGEVMCWGANSQGQIGDGTTTDRPWPVYVSGLTNVTEVAVGTSHACAREADGTVWCWGNNAVGQLGDGTTTSSLVPVNAGGISGITDVEVGLGHTCALDSAGLVYCWGSNTQGQLGTGNTTNVLIPFQPIAGLTATAISLGDAYSCAVVAGSVSCWGANASGQLGDTTTTTRLVPTPVSPALVGVTQVDAGDATTCARLNTNAVRCWGANAVGQIGDGTVVSKATPTAVTGITTATSVSVGAGFACARLSTNQVRCWGYNVGGQLGDGTTTNRSTSVLVSTLTTANTVSAGGVHACSLLADGSVSCWGANNAGQLGNGARDGFFAGRVPVQPSGIVSLATGYSGNGYSHTCALLGDGRVSCWGNNTSGEVGVGNIQSPLAPSIVSGLTNVVSIAAGADHTCAVKSDGTLWCWGSNGFGQLGTGTLVDALVPVQANITTNNAVSVAAHADNTCIVRSTGGAACWGVNTNGQVGVDPLLPGDATLTDPVTGAVTEVYWLPREISGFNGDGTGLITTVAELAVGSAHVCARLDDTTVWCWGSGGAGEVGNGCDPKALGPIDPITGQPGNVNCDTPFPVEALGASGDSITAGDSHTCIANAVSGYVYCWGDNAKGQIGNNDPTVGNGRLPVLSPVAVFGIGTGPVDPALPLGAQLSPAVDVAAGAQHTCAIMADNTLQCWGSNGAGELKQDYQAIGRAIAPLVAPGVTKASIVTGGGSHTCMLTTDGTLQCWGYDGPVLCTPATCLNTTVGVGAFGNASLNSNPRQLGAVPSIPAGVQAQPLNQSMLVSWLPSNANGAIVTSYRVTANPGGAFCVATGTTQCTITGLTNGTSYTFSVTATNSFGTSAASAPTTPAAPIGIPSAPAQPTAQRGDQMVTVTWTAAAAGGTVIDSYDVFVYIGGVLQPGLGCSTTGALTCNVIGLTNGTPYSFTVTATNLIGQSLESFPSVPVIPSGKPFVVTGVGVTRTATTATVTWTPGSSNGLAIASYTVVATGGATPQTCINGVGIDAPNTCLVTGLSAGTAYTFSVKATNGNGDSPLVTVGAPSAFAATRGDHAVSLSWTAAAGGDSAATTYIVTSTPENKQCSTLATDATPTSCDITGLTNGVTYSFTVVAIDGNGQRVASSPVTATPAGLPFKATGVGVTRSGSDAIVSWTAANNNGAAITNYTVTASPGGKFCSTADSTTCTITGLDSTTAYTYSVIATNDVGNSLAKVVAAPGNFVVNRGDHEVTISWSAASGGESAITGYTVSTGVIGKSCTTLVTDVNPTSCTISGLTNGTAYTFTLTATDASGQTTQAPSRVVTPAGLPFKATGVGVTRSGTDAVVSWTASNNNGAAITQYKVTANPGGKFCITTDSTTCTINGLDLTTAYTYSVVATNNVGDSLAKVVAAPGNFVVTRGDHEVTITWSAAAAGGDSAITGYAVSTGVVGASCSTLVTDVNPTACTISGLTNGQAYTFTLTATDASGQNTEAASSTVTPAGIPFQVGKPLAVFGDRSATVSWAATNNNGDAITKYVVTASPDGAKCETVTTSCVVPGLTNGTPYTFTVTATNTVGTSPASDPADSVTPGAAPLATAFTTVVAGDKKVTLTWTAANANGRALTGYVVTSNVPGVGCSTAPEVVTCEISGLTNGTKYTFAVAGTNSLGTGEASPATAETVPFGKPTAVTTARITGVLKAKYLVIGVRGATSNGSPITEYRVKWAYGASKKFTAWKTIKANGVFNLLGWPKASTVKFQVLSVNAGGVAASKVFTLSTPKK